MLRPSPVFLYTPTLQRRDQVQRLKKRLEQAQLLLRKACPLSPFDHEALSDALPESDVVRLGLPSVKATHKLVPCKAAFKHW